MVSEFTKAKLNDTALALVPLLSLPVACSVLELGAMWERYAVVANLDGLSEAALKTRLCAGCRRARYCCVQCHQAARIDGGHGTVCGR